MVTLGGDSHKRTHTLVAVDNNGRQLGQKTLLATRAGHLEALQWAGRWPERRWALEDCRHVSRRLEADLLVAGEVVVRVPSKLTGVVRKVASTRGKSDPIDALAVARAALREPDLPMAKLDGSSREVRLRLDHRDDLVGERTRTQNRLRWHLHELEPETEIAARMLSRYHTLAAVERRLSEHQGGVAAIGLELVIRVRELPVRINELEGEIEGRVTGLAPDSASAQRVRSLDCGQGRRRGSRGQPFPVASSLRQEQRDRSGAGVVRQPTPPPSQSRRQSPAQPGNASHRGDPVEATRTCSGLHGEKNGRRQHEDRGPSCPQETHLGRGLSSLTAGPARINGKQNRRPRGSRLT
jgi:transposase